MSFCPSENGERHFSVFSDITLTIDITILKCAFSFDNLIQIHYQWFHVAEILYWFLWELGSLEAKLNRTANIAKCLLLLNSRFFTHGELYELLL